MCICVWILIWTCVHTFICICMHGSIYVVVTRTCSYTESAHRISLTFISPCSYYFKKARLHSQLRTYAEAQTISFLLKFLVEEVELLVRQSVFSKLSDTRGNHLLFSSQGYVKTVSIHFLLSSISVQDFSSCRASLFINKLIVCKRILFCYETKQILCFFSSSSLPSSASRSLPSSSFCQTPRMDLDFVKCFHLIVESIYTMDLHEKKRTEEFFSQHSRLLFNF